MILVFKTNISNKKEIKLVKPFLDGLSPNSKWNFDLQDCDNILRVDSVEIRSCKIIELLHFQGFDCIELQ